MLRHMAQPSKVELCISVHAFDFDLSNFYFDVSIVISFLEASFSIN